MIKKTAQIDRFMLKLNIKYPNKTEERNIMDRMTSGIPLEPKAVAFPQNVFDAREVVGEIFVDERIRSFIIDLVFATRDPASYDMMDLSDLIEYGASPRATIALLTAARAHAFIRGRGYVIPEDVKAIGFDVLRHRIIVTFEAEAENVNSDEIIQKLFDQIEVP